MYQRFLRFLMVVVAMLSLSTAHAELVIKATKPANNAVKIAIAPIKYSGGLLSENISFIVSSDLARSGLFDVIPESDMLSFPSRASDVYYRDWSLLGSQYLVVGEMRYGEDGYYVLRFSLLSVTNQRVIFEKQTRGRESQLRDMAHYVSDEVYQQITGIPGAFSTKIAYITSIQESANRIEYRLNVSDADGAREQLMVQSYEPLMSPSWSPDGKQLAYVSFETGRPAIFRQVIATGEREQLTNFTGLNGAPSWSPDGQKLALVLSKDGNPEIYLFDLSSRSFTRLTRHFAIDTEPSWMPDGKHILFTSDRGGTPQIYKLAIDTGDIERITFRGNYNAKATLAPDGRTLALVHRDSSIFNIASLDLETGIFRVLTETRLDESPTVSPNGAMIIYATKQGDKGVLAAVSLDAGVKFILPEQKANVREPAWSPN